MTCRSWCTISPQIAPAQINPGDDPFHAGFWLFQGNPGEERESSLFHGVIRLKSQAPRISQYPIARGLRAAITGTPQFALPSAQSPFKRPA